jgi:hypothetical protein
MLRSLILTATVTFLSACNCGPVVEGPDASIQGDSGTPNKPDGGTGVIILPYDASTNYPEVYAGEACPAESFGQVSTSDASVTIGVCVALRTLSGQALLNNAPAPSNINLKFVAGNFQSEIDRTVDSLGGYQVKIMRGRYDLLKYWPLGVFPTHEGHLDFGYLDMTRDQNRSLVARSHKLRGGVSYGGLPFVPSSFPQDVGLQAFGSPQVQSSAVASSGGSYELSMLEGQFALFLSAPSQSLYGTELRAYQLNTSNLEFNRDQEFDISIPTSLIEGEITIDGLPIPDRHPGPDFQLSYVRPGDKEAQVATKHEGGLSGFAALVPKGSYGVKFDFVGGADRHYPAEVFGKPISTFIDVTNADGHLSANLNTFHIEGGIAIDNQQIVPRPSYNWRMFMFGFNTATDSSSFLKYEVPLDSASFSLRTFPGNYFVALYVNDGLAPDLAEGFYIVDRYFQVTSNRSLPIRIDTSMFTGTLKIDGQVPPTGKSAGTMAFRNRALTAQFSWYYRKITVNEDGSFSVRLPKGEYEVYFTIDNETFPNYASGRQRMRSRVNLNESTSEALDYNTIEVSGPIRVDKKIVEDTLPGPEVGLILTRAQDSREFEWNFSGGTPNYTLRIPAGDYGVDFVIKEKAIEGVAFGNAPMGTRWKFYSGTDDSQQ